ncbi:MAG: bifunctional protein-serine/threonine kinase/phosphatase [Exilibacterium sp.]
MAVESAEIVESVMPVPLVTSSESSLEIVFGGYTSAGAKPDNEDAFAAFQPPSLSTRQLKGAVACLADGVSSSDKAQVASQTSVTHFIEDYYSTSDTWPVKTSAARVLSALNAWLYHHGQHSGAPNSLVTTFSAVVIKSNTAHLFHVGDSRIYRLRTRTLEQLSRDHSHRQVGGRHFLTRALGMDSHLEVDYHQEEVVKGDLLMLTSDGVHDVLTAAELKALLSGVAAGLEETAKAIVERALEKGSEDNLSCLLLKVVNLPNEEIDEVHRKLSLLAIPPVMNVGMKLDGYEVIRVLHSGTRSHIYLVKDPCKHRPLVLKAPSENFSDDAQYLEGFIREQWVGQRVNHAGVMKIYPRREFSPFLYHLCEYIEGQTLRQWMYDNPQPSLEQVREILRGVVAALRAFQRMSMVHRDLKPENIILTQKHQVKLIDFGTVKVSGLDEIASPLREEYPVGSVNYIAPEYLLGMRGMHSSDIFSLGVIIYEMLCGEMPYKMDSAHRRVPKHYQNWRYQSVQQYRAGLPLWVDLTLKKATNPNPTHRYQALSEFERDLCTPNESMLRQLGTAPLLERNPSRFWQLLALLMTGVVIAQWVLLAG